MTPTAARFRLVIHVDGEAVVFGDRVFGDFCSAQARVADAVRSLSARGRIQCVELQQSAPGGWAVRRRWGSDVVDRICRQGGIQPQARPSNLATTASIDTAQEPSPAPDDNIAMTDAARLTPAARRAAPHFAAPVNPPLAGHRPTRYALLSSAAIVLFTTGAIHLLQAGGPPLDEFSAVRPGVRHGSVVTQVPFEAGAFDAQRRDSRPGRTPESLGVAEAIDARRESNEPHATE
ncbi:MAG: hypothetical protein U1D55_10675 [Phycisphaerae bacterium]